MVKFKGIEQDQGQEKEKRDVGPEMLRARLYVPPVPPPSRGKCGSESCCVLCLGREGLFCGHALGLG